jgi:type II secretory pathway pseudopilin PulG
MLSRRLRELREMGTDSGVSLTELLVAMGLMTTVGAMALAYFVSSSASSSRTTNETLTATQLRTAMSAVTTLFRLADTPTAQAGFPTNRFDQITAAQVTFYSNVNNNRVASAARTAPAKIVLTATSTQLIEKYFLPLAATVPADYTQNYGATASSTRVLVDSLSNTSAFTYCAVLNPDARTCKTPATTGDTVAAVTVSLKSTGLRGESPQYLTSTIGITGALS